jgi:hypothetical protein
LRDGTAPVSALSARTLRCRTSLASAMGRTP